MKGEAEGRHPGGCKKKMQVCQMVGRELTSLWCMLGTDKSLRVLWNGEEGNLVLKMASLPFVFSQDDFLKVTS